MGGVIPNERTDYRRRIKLTHSRTILTIIRSSVGWHGGSTNLPEGVRFLTKNSTLVPGALKSVKMTHLFSGLSPPHTAPN